MVGVACRLALRLRLPLVVETLAPEAIAMLSVVVTFRPALPANTVLPLKLTKPGRLPEAPVPSSVTVIGVV